MENEKAPETGAVAYGFGGFRWRRMGVPGGDAMRRLEPWAHEPRFESTNFPRRSKKDTPEECLFYYAENA
jgi:hypothetical protein